MPGTDTHPTACHILQVFQHFGLTQAHVAARIAADWQGLATAHPTALASLMLICPRGMDPGALVSVSSRLGVLAGEHGRSTETLRRVMARFPEATLTTLRGYEHPSPYADIAVNCTAELAVAMLAFLEQRAQQHPLPSVALPASEGDVGDIMYRVRGAGPPLVLLPLSVAPAPWDPLLPQLSQR